MTVNNNANPAAPNPWRGALTIFTAKRGTGTSPDVYRADSRMAEIGARMQSFTYDLDGNLTSDGIVDYQWDAENRLIRMETNLTARSWGFPHRLLEFRYDYLGRRVQKRVIDVTQNQEILSRRYLYDGWNLVAEYAAPGGSTCGVLLRSYTWGLDIVNTMANAGGVCALLQIADHPSGKTYLPTYDGNGNIAALVNASTGALAAAYEYSPYGEPLRAQTLDPVVADNPFRFSTKFTDLETGLVYYGARFYSPSQGRFLGRDPIEEAGGLNLYGFGGNDAINAWDFLGYDGVTATEHGTFLASVTDLMSKVREWTFSSQTDAENWYNAWGEGNADLLQPYLERIAAGEVAKRAASIVSDPVVATIYLNGLGGGSILRDIFTGYDGVSDDNLAAQAISEFGASAVFTMVFGSQAPPIKAKTLTLVAGVDSSIEGGLSDSDRQAIIVNAKTVERLLEEQNSWHIQTFLLISNKPLVAPQKWYDFNPRSVDGESAVSQLRGGTTGIVPIVITNKAIVRDRTTQAAACSIPASWGGGIIADCDRLSRNPFTLAHELGHVGNYYNYTVAKNSPKLADHAPIGDDRNLMHEYAGLRYVRMKQPLLVHVDGAWLSAINRVAIPVR